MTHLLPWKVTGARVHLPRDVAISYTVGRMGVATAAQVGPLYYGSHNTARFGFARLLKLGLLRTFERADPSCPAWYALSKDAAPWVADEFDCAEEELRVVSGIRRTNLAAVAQRNDLWVSLALACRATGGQTSLALFRPEWELRRMKPKDVPIVPDALFVLVGLKPSGESEHVWMVELDAGTERAAVWKAKAEAYAALRGRGLLYGAERWNVLAIVPSPRRARSIAAAVTTAGGGAFTYLVARDALTADRAFSNILWRAAALAASKSATASASLIDEAVSGTIDPDQRGQSAADGVSEVDSGGNP